MRGIFELMIVYLSIKGLMTIKRLTKVICNSNSKFKQKRIADMEELYHSFSYALPNIESAYE